MPQASHVRDRSVEAPPQAPPWLGCDPTRFENSSQYVNGSPESYPERTDALPAKDHLHKVTSDLVVARKVEV